MRASSSGVWVTPAAKVMWPPATHGGMGRLSAFELLRRSRDAAVLHLSFLAQPHRREQEIEIFGAGIRRAWPMAVDRLFGEICI